MFKRLLEAFKQPRAAATASHAESLEDATARIERETGDQLPEQPTPFGAIYELLFCDRPELFEPQDGVAPEWKKLLFEQTNADLVQALAEDTAQESRVRLLAYRWLASRGIAIESNEILGVVIEVGLEQGNDTLAAYEDGSVRYINQSGKLAVFEGAPPEVVAAAKELVTVSRSTVDRIGPWEGPRRAPPARGDIRLTFLVANGLYFGEGPFEAMEKEPMAKPVIRSGIKLLQLCVAAVTSNRK